MSIRRKPLNLIDVFNLFVDIKEKNYSPKQQLSLKKIKPLKTTKWNEHIIQKQIYRTKPLRYWTRNWLKQKR